MTRPLAHAVGAIVAVGAVLAACGGTSKRAEVTSTVPVPVTSAGPTTAAAPTTPAGPPTTAAPTLPPTTALAPKGPSPAVAAPGTPSTFAGWVDPTSSGQPYSAVVDGMLTFRGNPTRTFYGKGPVPVRTPVIDWKLPKSGNWCSVSGDIGNPDKVWCGMGWTDEPAVWERGGVTWMAFGAYDGNVHFVNANTGVDLLPPFHTNDIIKGSVTVDPDGFPLIYIGSRDDYFRVISIDGNEPKELYKFYAHAVAPTLWNNDWDGSALVLGDYLFEGGENSRFHIWRLNRAYDANGKATVKPELVFHTAGWDDQLLKDIGDLDVSIENSVAISGSTVYFANSGGLVQGWDLSGLKEGRAPTRVMRFWTGDDTDASVVVDDQGFLYVGSEYERLTNRSKQVGQFFKLDPRKPDDPIVWSLKIGQKYETDGIWATAALWKDIVIVPTDDGQVYGVDRATGAIRWIKKLGGPVWSSPVVVDGIWVQGDCRGVLRGMDVHDTTVEPPVLWEVQLGSCIESTPVVWKGRVYAADRGGHIYGMHAP